MKLPFTRPKENCLTIGYKGSYPFYPFPVNLSGRELHKHKHVVGLSGVGKSSFLVHVASSLILSGIPMSFIDPHGDSVELLVGVLAARGYFNSTLSYDRFLYFEFGRKDLYPPFNVLSQQNFDAETSARNLVSAMLRAYPELGITFRDIFYFTSCILAANNYPVTYALRVLNDRSFRERLLENITNPLVHEYFHSEVDSWDERIAEANIGSTKRRL